jgi:hypothetical protein
VTDPAGHRQPGCDLYEQMMPQAIEVDGMPVPAGDNHLELRRV